MDLFGTGWDARAEDAPWQEIALDCVRRLESVLGCPLQVDVETFTGAGFSVDVRGTKGLFGYRAVVGADIIRDGLHVRA